MMIPFSHNLLPARPAKGFTLNELLIALVVLGVIAAFAIPKVLKAVNDNRQVAQLREAAFILEDGFYSNRMASVNFYDQVANANDDLYHFLVNDINIITGSDTAKGPPGYTEGCNNPQVANGYFQLHNGMIVSGLAGADDSSKSDPRYQLICIDIDGAVGKNLAGTDIFYGNFLYDNDSSSKSFFWSSVASSPPNSADNQLCADNEDSSCTLTVAIDSTSEDVGHMLSRNE
jgi:prepilin-type N-terminal cleavage/methylation domain-containing protein